MCINDPRFKKWDKWLGEIHDDIVKLLCYRFVLKEVFEIVRSNPKIDGSNFFFEWMLIVYGEAVSAGVRRHADMHKDVTSLAKLLSEIYSDPKILSVDPSEVKYDLDELNQKSRTIKDFVDRQIAHLDKKSYLGYPDCLHTKNLMNA